MKKCAYCNEQYDSSLTLCPICGAGGKSKLSSINETLTKFGDASSNLGRKLTLGLTIPILLTLIFGIFGFVIGLLIFVATFFSGSKR